MKKLIYIIVPFLLLGFSFKGNPDWKNRFATSRNNQEKYKKTLQDILTIVTELNTIKDENKINIPKVQKKLTTLIFSNYFIVNQKDSLQKIFISDSLQALYDSLASKKPVTSNRYLDEFMAIKNVDTLNFLAHQQFGIITGTSVDNLPLKPGKTGKTEYYLANIKKMLDSNSSVLKEQGLTFKEYQKMEADQHFQSESKSILFRKQFIEFLQSEYNL